MLGFVQKRIEQQRKDLDIWSKERDMFFAVPDSIEMLQDIPYICNGDERNNIDIFRQRNCKSTLPVIINIHGGGLLMGNKAQNKGFNIWLCEQGFLVYSVEYNLVPDVTVQEQLCEINSAMFFIKNRIEYDGGDIDKVCVVGDSAGAFLAVYCTAIQNSEKLSDAFNIMPAKLDIKAIGLQSGMFYTTKFDEIGLFLPKTLYGKEYKSESFAKYLNPEHKEIISNLPPTYLMTSESDNLKRYTLWFKNALSKNNIEYEFECYPENENMSHAFGALYPERKESIIANKEMVRFLKERLNIFNVINNEIVLSNNAMDSLERSGNND